jgi:putative nucleotidyltransferase with HDIG domain
MRVVTIDRSWLVTPFLSHRLTITSQEQIEQLKACGVQVVEIAVDGDKETVGQDVPEPLTTDGEANVPVRQEECPDPQAASFDEELTTAKEVYRAAKAVIQGAMQDVRLGRAINMEAVNRVVSDMAESVLRNLDALTSLSRLKRFDEYTFYHSVNTSLLAMSLGRDLGFTKNELHQIGVGALLHDIGKTKIPNELLNKPARLEPDEMELMKQHVLRGVEILSDLAGLSEVHAKPALEHHERVDGTGYPFRRSKDQILHCGHLRRHHQRPLLSPRKTSPRCPAISLSIVSQGSSRRGVGATVHPCRWGVSRGIPCRVEHRRSGGGAACSPRGPPDSASHYCQKCEQRAALQAARMRPTRGDKDFRTDHPCRKGAA